MIARLMLVALAWVALFFVVQEERLEVLHTLIILAFGIIGAERVIEKVVEWSLGPRSSISKDLQD